MNIQPTNTQVDKIFERFTQPGSAGCALTIMKDGEIIYKQGYGLANLEHKVPILPSTVFNIGSMAKQFTAFAIALLAADGKLSLDDDIRRYLPEMHDFRQTITIRHLIHHTSGLRGSFPELLALAEWREGDVTTRDDVFWLLKAQRELNFRPGDEYLYVNSNYVLLSIICERASSQSFADFCQDRIFVPLGMTSTFVHDSYFRLIPGRAGGYYQDEQMGWINVSLADSVLGSTNVYSTVEDLARWDENFYTGKVGGRVVIELVHQPGRLNNGTELDYAFGLEVGPTHMHRGWQVVEHGGNHGGHGGWMLRFPKLHLSVAVLFNLFLWEMRDYATQVADLFLEDTSPLTVEEQDVEGSVETQEVTSPPRTEPVELSQEQLEERAGTYFNARRAAVREVNLVNDRLQFLGLDLVSISENRFFFEVEPHIHVEFTPGAEGAVQAVKTITPSGEYQYDRVEKVSPTPDKLAEYVGWYYSPELDIYWRIEAGDGGLIAKRRKYVDSSLLPLFADAFSDDWAPILGYPTTYLVVFERDVEDTITGLRVSGSRVRNLRFSRTTDPRPGWPIVGAQNLQTSGADAHLSKAPDGPGGDGIADGIDHRAGHREASHS